jgi:predicted NBD/HSP70 family sugar kinase
MMVNPKGQPCRCGSTGCWETEAGEAALLRRAGLGDRSGHLDEVARRAGAGEERALAAIADVGRWLGLGIGNLVNLFNPDLVVLGGLYQRLFPYLEPSLRDGVAQRALEAPGKMATIACSGLGPDAPLMGAAELVLSGVIADPAGVLGRVGKGRASVIGGAKA